MHGVVRQVQKRTIPLVPFWSLGQLSGWLRGPLSDGYGPLVLFLAAVATVMVGLLLSAFTWE